MFNKILFFAKQMRRRTNIWLTVFILFIAGINSVFAILSAPRTEHLNSISIVIVTNVFLFSALLLVWFYKKWKEQIRKIKYSGNYLEVFKNSPIPFLIFAEDTLTFLAANKAALDFYGLNEEEYVNLTMIDLQPEKDRVKSIQQLILLETNSNQQLDTLHQRANGEIVAVSILFYPIFFQNRKCYSVYIQPSKKEKANNSETKNLISKNNNYELFESIIQSQTLFLLRFDGMGQILFANQSFMQFLGWPELSESVNLLDLLTEGSKQSFIDSMQICLANPGSRKKTKVKLNENFNAAYLIDLELVALPDLEGNYHLQATGKLKSGITQEFGSANSPYERFAQIAFNIDTFVVDRFECLSKLPLFELIATSLKSDSFKSIIALSNREELSTRLKEANLEQTVCEFVRISKDKKSYWVCFSGQVFEEHQTGNKIFKGILLEVPDNSIERRSSPIYIRKISQLLNVIAEGFCLIEANGKVLYANNALKQLLGLTINNLEGATHFNDLLKHFGVYELEKRFKRILELREFSKFDIYYEKSDKYLSFSVYPILDGIAVLVKDISEFTKSSQALMKSRQNLTTLINSTTDYIWSVDTNFILISANRNFIQYIFNRTGVRLKVGRSVYVKEYGDAANERWAMNYKKAFTGKFLQFEEAFVMPNGEYHTAEVSFNPILDNSGKVIGAGCFARDIANQKKQELLLRTQNNQLLNIAWKHSHEVRAPLANILGLLNVYNLAEANDPMNAIIIEKLKEAATKLDAILQEVIRLGDNASKIDSENKSFPIN